MSDYLKIKKNGIYGYQYNSDKKKYIGKKIKKNRILTALRSSCKIDKDVILLDIIKHMEHYKLLKSFISFYSWCPSINELNLDAFTPVTEDKKSNIKYLRISWSASDFKWKNKKEFNESPDFIGVGIDEEGLETRHSVSYCPLYEIAYLPVVLDTTFKIFEESVLKSKDLYESTKDFTLLDILDAIYWDISFVGGPKQKEEFLDKLNDRLDEIDDI